VEGSREIEGDLALRWEMAKGDGTRICAMMFDDFETGRRNEIQKIGHG
jgi:hypothetical protein